MKRLACEIFWTFVLWAILALAVTVGRAFGGQLTLTWTDNNAGGASTAIERKEGEGGYVGMGSVGPGVTAYVDATAVAGKAYCYKVFAFDGSGESPDSNEACVATISSQPQPGCYVQPPPIAPGTLVCGVGE